MLTSPKLKPPCVELSQTALQFRAHQVGSRKVLDALKVTHKILADLGREDAFDERLANYAFFPLQHIFNEAKRISSGCLELAVRCLQILVSQGWRAKLEPTMGKQLVILMSLLAGGIPGGSVEDSTSEELTLASLECMAEVFRCLGQGRQRHAVFDETAARTLVDQSVYMLLEKVTDDASPDIQAAATSTLDVLYAQLSDRVLLASLFPRTVSALTKALRVSTKVRRTFKVLVANIHLLSHVIQVVLNDSEAIHESQLTEKSHLQANEDSKSEDPILDASWLRATAAQVTLALTHVVRLRYHDRIEVREALGDLCQVVIDDCSKSLSEALSLMIETLVVLAHTGDGPKPRAFSALSHLISSDAPLSEILEGKIRSWTSALPRIMQGSDDSPKQRTLQQISTGLEILARRDPALEIVDEALASNLCDSLAMAFPTPKALPAQVLDSQGMDIAPLALRGLSYKGSFDPVLFNERGQQGSLAELDGLIIRLSNSDAANSFTKAVLNRLSYFEGSSRLSAMWLSLRLLGNRVAPSFELSDFVDISSSVLFTRPYLIEELYSNSLPLILEPSSSPDWRLSALSLETLILQAQQLGQSFRPELMEILYPVLSLLGSSQAALQSHAVTALNLLATACDYNSVSTMLVENVDYLINAVSLKLTYGDVSPQGAQVLLMMVRLCGAKVIPYLDDMITSIFDILDQYHGYPKLVEMLFEVLNAVVDEGAKQPRLAITGSKQAPNHGKHPFETSSLNDIFGDLERQRERSLRLDSDVPSPGDEQLESHPKRPWTSTLDGPLSAQQNPKLNSSDLSPSHSTASSSSSRFEDEAEPSPPPDESTALSKPHSLLLSILNATPPHLSSPSPRVRLIILRLITRIAPLLSVDENSFLPAINAIWPSLVARLVPPSSTTSTDTTGVERAANKTQSLILTDQSPFLSSEFNEEHEEPTYTLLAALTAFSSLARTAGDFLTTRIEALFPDLQRRYIAVYTSIYTALRRHEARRQDAVKSKRITPMELETAGNVLRGNEAQTLKALVGLFVNVLAFVRVDEDLGEGVVRLLIGVCVDGVGEKVDVDVQEVRRVCTGWNGDLVWLLDRETKLE